MLDADGHPVQARWPAMLERLILRPDPAEGDVDPEGPASERIPQSGELPGSEEAPGSGKDSGTPSGRDPERIAATTGGTGFRLADCVQALCENVLSRVA